MSNKSSEATSEFISTTNKHNKDGATGAATNVAIRDSQHIEVTSKQEKSKGATTKPTKGKATSTDNPQQFIRRIVYQECNEEKILGSVHYYDATKEMFYVVYDDGEGKYVEKNELLNMLATEKEVLEARPIPPQSYKNSSKKAVFEKKKRSASGEGSTPTKKKGSSSGKKEHTPHVALVCRAINSNK